MRPAASLPTHWPSELQCFAPISRAINADRAAAAKTVFELLTSREIDVLTGISCGDSNKDLARQLQLTPETVKWHLKNAMRKLNADSRSCAVRKAAALGLALAD